MMYSPGLNLALRFEGDRNLWHERFVLARVKDMTYVCLTPEGEIEVENLALEFSDGAPRIRMPNWDRSLHSVREEDYYRWEDYHGEVLAQRKLDEYIQEGELIAQGLRPPRLGAPGSSGPVHGVLQDALEANRPGGVRGEPRGDRGGAALGGRLLGRDDLRGGGLGPREGEVPAGGAGRPGRAEVPRLREVPKGSWEAP
jgi:hypothetical protein